MGQKIIKKTLRERFLASIFAIAAAAFAQLLVPCVHAQTSTATAPSESYAQAFLSTSEDLAKFGSALLQPGFLKPESLRLLFTSQKTTDGKETGYGIGWSVGQSKSGKKIYHHNGGAVGFTSRLILYPDSHIVVAMICNLDGDNGWKDEEVESVGEAFEKK